MNNKYKNISVISTGSWVPSDLNENAKTLKTYKVFINDLVLNAFIGIHEHEKKKKQKISISISLESLDNIIKASDKIENVVSYEFVISDIKKLINKKHIGLIETLGENIAKICFKDPRVICATINVKKLAVFKETKNVGIEIFRERNSEENYSNFRKLKKNPIK